MPRKVDFSFDRSIGVADLLPLFRQAPWAAQRSDKVLQQLLRQSPVKLGGWHNDRLVAFARALTDDCCRALVDDVIVDAEWRGQGVGTEIIRRMVERFGHVEEVLLHCEVEVAPFYERSGFRQDAVCMVKR